MRNYVIIVGLLALSVGITSLVLSVIPGAQLDTSQIEAGVAVGFIALAGVCLKAAE